MGKNKKRYLMFALFVVLLLVVCYANYRINNGPIVKEEEAALTDAKGEDSESDVASGDDSFAVLRQDRDSVRAKEIEYLDSIVLNEDTDKETRTQAQNQKLELISSMEKEVTIEGLLKAKGFSDVAVTVHKGSVNVVVNTEALTDSDVAKILDIVHRETKEKTENIKVMPKN